MKTLKTASFVSERVKVKPVTNAEWEQIKKDIEEPGGFRKIKNPSANDIRQGMTVCVDENTSALQWYIVFDGGNLPKWVDDYITKIDKCPGRLLFIHYDKFSSHNYAYWRFSSFEKGFPYHFLYPDTKIVGVYDTKINTMNIKTTKELLDVLNDIQAKIIK